MDETLEAIKHLTKLGYTVTTQRKNKAILQKEHINKIKEIVNNDLLTIWEQWEALRDAEREYLSSLNSPNND